MNSECAPNKAERSTTSDVPNPVKTKRKRNRKPKVPVDYEPEILKRLGIFPDADGFVCLICDRNFKSTGSSRAHSYGRRHCNILSQVNERYTKVEGQFACNLCPGDPAVDWKSFLVHFGDQEHFDNLDAAAVRNIPSKNHIQYSRVSYVVLEMCQIIERDAASYFCCCCGMTMVGWKSVSGHINDKQHRERQQGSVYEHDGEEPEEESRKLVTNFLTHISSTLYYCYLCERSISGRKNCQQHMDGTEHRKLKEKMCKTSEEKHVIDYQPLSEKLKLSKNSTKETPKPVRDMSPQSWAELMRVNLISGPHNGGTYLCKLCGCSCSGLPHVREHISGKQHRKMKEQACKKSPSDTESEKTSRSLSDCRVSSENSLFSWESYESESGSCETSENSSKSWEKLDSVSSRSWETVSTRSLVAKRCEETPFEIPEDYVFLISKNSLQKRERELYCAACKAHLMNLQSLIDHTNSKYHILALLKFRAKTGKTENKILSATSDSSSAVNLPVHPSIEKLAQPETQSQKSEKPADTREHEGTSIPLEPHLLERYHDDMLCLACNVHFTDVNEYFIHISNESHRAMLDKVETKSQTNEKPVDTRERESTSIPLEPHVLKRYQDDILCLACNVHFTDVNKYFIHISSKSHRATLEKYRTEVMNKNDSTDKTLKLDTAPKFSPPAVEKTSSTTEPKNNETIPKSIITNPQNPESELMDLPEKSLSRIAIHSLKHLKKSVYCPACEVHLRDAESVVTHTNSPRHATKLTLFRARTLSEDIEIHKALYLSVVEAQRDLKLIKETLTDKSDPQITIKLLSTLDENVTALEKSVNKLTIAEIESTNSDVSNADKSMEQNLIKNSTSSEESEKLPPNASKYFKDRQMNRKQAQRQNNNHIRGRGFDPKYLKVDMKHIYELSPEKLRIMKLSCQLCFPKTSEELYCLMCERSVASELQGFYEHLCSTSHTKYLAEVEQHDKHFILYPEQFSDLALSKEFLQQTSAEEIIQCLACDIVLENNDAVIFKHINEDFHKKRKQVWNATMDKILKDILVKIESTWYNIQKYWCQPCDMLYNTEFHFAEHMEKRHNSTRKKKHAYWNKLVYDACIPCAMLWLGSSNIYTQHCDQPMHKYLLQTGDYSICTLPGHVKTLLESSETEVNKLIELSDQVSTVQKEKADNLLKCLEDTVKSKFPEAKAYPFGSRVSGLGFPDSDIDVFLDCGTYDGTKHSEDFQMEIIMTVEYCFYSNQQSWEIEETLTSSRTPIIKLRHRSTELSCDISFKNGLSVENTMLLKCYMDNYPLCRKLMLFIKKWLYFCNLSGSQYITNYAICWYVIFYLQRKSILPSVASLIAKENKSKIIDGWETGICKTFDACQKEFMFTELLIGFFEFYTNFDYRYSVACPIIGSTTPKQDFTELHLLPKEMAPYVNHIKRKGFNGPVELFRIDSEMCIQDPYDLSHNLTKAVRKFTLNRFKQLCASSADVLNNLQQH